MDVVRKDIEDLKGEVTLGSQLGRGTTVSIRLPLTLAVIPTLLVECAGQKYALPTSSVKKVVEIDPDEIHSVEGREAIVCDGKTVPLVSMKDVLCLRGESSVPERSKFAVVIVAHAQDVVGFLVDSIAGEQRLVVKNLAGNLGQIDNVAGGASLGTGEVVIILHVPDLISAARAAPSRKLAEELTTRLTPVERRGTVLVVEDSLTTRELQRSILEAAGYEVEVAVDGLDGLRKVTDHEYDLVITDIAMPRMDGFEMVQRIKRDPRRKAVPVIIVTSRASEADKKRGMAVGADQFIVKSQFDQSSFLEMVSTFVG
jgi:two-component system chemotaxis sensor kinase CheA